MENKMGREECIIQVIEEDWVRQMEEEFKEVKQRPKGEFKRWKGMSIYRVPLSLKKLSEKSYQPQVVAIGPYHHKKKKVQLKEMEEHKKRALRVFLDKSNKPLDEYVNALTPMLQDLKNAYQQHPQLKCSDFLKMMVIDGCFLLELLRTSSSDKDLSYARNDPVFSKYGLIYFGPQLKRDMLMLENQIPLRVLNKLVEVACKKDTYPDVTDSILNFFELSDGNNKAKFKNSLHILDVYRRSLLSLGRKGSKVSGSRRCMDKVCCINSINKTKNKNNGEYQMRSATNPAEASTSVPPVRDCITSINNKKNDEKDRKSWIRHCVDKISFGGGKLRPPSISADDTKKKNDEFHMRPATDLAEAGIQFQCMESGSRYLDQISFHKGKGKLRLPPILVDDATKTIYLNMMAFEWFHVNRCLTEEDKENYNEGFHVTAYVFFMDRLIDTAKDVSLLHKHHIMQYTVCSDQSVADIFNTLSKDICIDSNHKLEDVQKEVAKYYRKTMPGCIAYAKRTYFANTWVTLSIFAAIFLFALTITQTVYAVLDYHKSDAPAPDYHKAISGLH